MSRALFPIRRPIIIRKMKRSAIIVLFIMLFAGLAYGQAPEKRFVGNCRFSGFSLLADSSYRGNIIQFDDRMGDGYNLTQLAVGYEILDGRGLVFEIDTIHSSTNFTADVSVTAKVNRGFEPFGSGQVYYPTASGLIPPSSQEQSGLSPTQKARIDRHNVVTMETLIGGRDSVYSITYVSDTSSLSAVTGDAFINSTADTLGLYNGTGWQLFYGGGSVEQADGETILGDGSSGDKFRVNTDSLHAVIVAMDNQSPMFIPPCESSDNITLNFTIIDAAIRSGDDISVDITVTGTGWSLLDVIEHDGYASGRIFGTALSAGTRTFSIAYSGVTFNGSFALELQDCPGAGHDTSAYFHRRLTFGTDYTLPTAVLDTADVISIYAGAQTSSSVTITLPTLSDTTYDGKIIYVRGSGTENGDIMRITSPDSTDILVQGCQSMGVQDVTPTDSTNIDITLTSYANTTGPDTITATYSVLYMYLISNGKYYRYCQHQQGPPKGAVFQIDMTTAATSTTVDFNAPTAGEDGGVYTFHFLNTANNEVDFPSTFLNQTGTEWDASSTYTINNDFFMTCYFDGTNFHCK